MSATPGQTFTPVSPARRSTLARRAQWLAGASVIYNVVEAIVAISAGKIASSAALVGFGLDSTIEVASGLIILWQFRHPLPESREKTAGRLIAVAFFALAVFVGQESIRSLLNGVRPDASTIGVGLAVASLMIMPFLSWAQRRTGKELGSSSVHADGTQTLLCTYLSAVLLIGLLANALLGWWWLDAVAALVIAGVAVREGIQSWRGDGCCSAGTGGPDGPPSTGGCS